jgi:hypothetical protein
MADLRQKVYAVPAAFRAVAQFFWLIGQSDDPYRFIYYVKQGDVEKAFETLDASDKQIHDMIGRMRDEAEIVAEEVPEFREAKRDELIE